MPLQTAIVMAVVTPALRMKSSAKTPMYHTPNSRRVIGPRDSPHALRDAPNYPEIARTKLTARSFYSLTFISHTYPLSFCI